MLARTPIVHLLTADNLIAWLKDQPPDKRYLYESCCGCLIAQFLHDHGHEDVTVGPGYVRRANEWIDFPDYLENAVSAKPRTFGDALARLEAAGRRN